MEGIQHKAKLARSRIHHFALGFSSQIYLRSPEGSWKRFLDPASQPQRSSHNKTQTKFAKNHHKCQTPAARDYVSAKHPYLEISFPTSFHLPTVNLGSNTPCAAGIFSALHPARHHRSAPYSVLKIAWSPEKKNSSTQQEAPPTSLQQNRICQKKRHQKKGCAMKLRDLKRKHGIFCPDGFVLASSQQMMLMFFSSGNRIDGYVDGKSTDFDCVWVTSRGRNCRVPPSYALKGDLFLKKQWNFLSVILVFLPDETPTLQGINISHLGERKIIFKMAFLGDMLVSWSVFGNQNHSWT